MKIKTEIWISITTKVVELLYAGIEFLSHKIFKK